MSLRDPEVRAFIATTLKERIRAENDVSTTTANEAVSALGARHCLEIAILDAIRAADDVVLVFWLQIWIHHARPSALVLSKKPRDTPRDDPSLA